MFRLLAILCSGIFLAGCFSSEAPDCSDYDTKELIMQIIKEDEGTISSFAILGLDKFTQNGDELNVAGKKGNLNISLTAIRTTNFNEKIGSYTCAADVNMKHKDNKGKMKEWQHPITYTSEIADDGDNFYVSVSGL